MRKTSGKKLLIMGANPETVSLVEKARSMGIRTLVTDNNPNAYAKHAADEPYNVDAADVQGVVNLAITNEVDGVIVGVAESLLPFYCDVCEQLGFPCFGSKETFALMTDKAAFKSKCREYGVPVIEEFHLDELEESCFPVIVKPTDGCSSRGITVCQNANGVMRAIEKAREQSRSGDYLIERCADGDEVVSYYAIQDGNPFLVAMCDRYVFKQSDDTVQLPTCYVFPSLHYAEHLRTADAPLKRLINGVGMRNGSVFFQGFAGTDGIMRVYEPGYRLNGAQEHLLVSRVSGIDVKEMYINYALFGRVSDIELESRANPHPERIGFKLSPLVRCGRIGRIEGLEAICKMPGIVSVNPSYIAGDIVEGYGTLKQIACRFFALANSPVELVKIAESIMDKFHVLDESGKEMLLDCFDPSIIAERYR